jgi:hypothetical protein
VPGVGACARGQSRVRLLRLRGAGVGDRLTVNRLEAPVSACVRQLARRATATPQKCKAPRGLRGALCRHSPWRVPACGRRPRGLGSGGFVDRSALLS